MCGILTALAVIFLLLAVLLPTGRIGCSAIAGIFPAMAVIAGGLKWGFFCWASAGILGLVLLPDKGIVLLFLSVLGLYPVIKAWIEQMRKLIPEWVCKLAYFNLALTALWFFFRAFLLAALPAWLDCAPLLYLFCNVVFVLYDIGLSRLLTLFTPYLQKILRRKQ